MTLRPDNADRRLTAKGALSGLRASLNSERLVDIPLAVSLLSALSGLSASLNSERLVNIL
jgi:hypothetical protein